MKFADLLFRADRLIERDRLHAPATKSTTAACNLGQALMRGDGIRADPHRGADLLKSVLDSRDPMNPAFAHNFLGHFYRGGFGTEPNMPCALSHFEEAGQLGDGAFNAGLFLDKGAPGIARDMARAAGNYHRGVAHGSAMAMTNLTLMMLAGEFRNADPGKAIDLLERASTLGDAEAATVLLLIEAKSTTLENALSEGVRSTIDNEPPSRAPVARARATPPRSVMGRDRHNAANASGGRSLMPLCETAYTAALIG